MAQPDIRRYLRHGTLPQMRAFEASVRLGTLTRAASELHMAQATASVQVRKLAETVGLALFEQVGRRVQLTAAGERVHAGCAEVFRALSSMEAALAGLRGAAAGRLRLALPQGAQPFAARLVEAFMRSNPEVDASLEIHERRALVERLTSNADDLYMFIDLPEAREVVAQAVVPNPLVVLARADHPLAAEQEIPFARLAAEPFLLREPGAGTRLATLRLFAKHGVVPKTRIELASDEAIREAILAGLGVAILPRYSLGLDPVLTRLACLDVQGFPLESHWHFVYPVGKGPSCVARAFMDFARAEAKSLFRDCLRSSAGPN